MQRRLFKLASVSALLGMVACTAIAGLDGEFGLVADAGVGASETGTVADSSPSTDGGPGSGDARVERDASGLDADSGPGIEFDPVPPTSITPDSGVGAACPGSVKEPLYFCWDFGDPADNVGASWGWTSIESTGGSPVVVGTGFTYERALQAVVESTEAKPSVGTGLWLKVNDHPYPTGKALQLSFSFRVDSTATSATLGAMESGGKRYGLAFKSTGCGGMPCLTDTQASPLKQTAFQTNVWYRAAIRLFNNADGGEHWEGTVLVGGKLIGKVDFPFSAGDLDPLRIGVGAFDTVPPSGSATVHIDDVRLEALTP